MKLIRNSIEEKIKDRMEKNFPHPFVLNSSNPIRKKNFKKPDRVKRIRRLNLHFSGLDFTGMLYSLSNLYL